MSKQPGVLAHMKQGAALEVSFDLLTMIFVILCWRSSCDG